MAFFTPNETKALPEGYSLNVVDTGDGDLRLVAANEKGQWKGPWRLMHQTYMAVADAWRHDKGRT